MKYRWLSIKDTAHALGDNLLTDGALWYPVCGAKRGVGENYLFPIDTDRECPDCVRLVDRATHQHD